MSSELKNKVYVDKIELEFFSRASLRGVLILDKRGDTILNGEVDVTIKDFHYRKKSLKLDKILLKNITAKVIEYKGDSVFNYQFLSDYFTSGKKDTTVKQEWDITLGDIELENVAFVYRLEKFQEKASSNINFDDISLKHTYGTLSGFKFEKDTMIGILRNFRTIEKSGFTITELSTKARISNKRLLCDEIVLKTTRSSIKGKVDFSYTSWDDFPDFITKVYMDSYLTDSTYVSFTDIAAFTQELNGLNETVKISGKVKGTVSDMSLKNLKFEYGSYSRFRGNLSLVGLPDIKATFIHFDAKEVATNYIDIVRLPQYPFTGPKKMEVPLQLKRLGTVSYKGKFDGFFSDFTTFGTFTTDLGKLRAELSIKLGKKPEDLSYEGKINSENFELGTLLGQTDFNNLTVNSEIKGKGNSVKTIEAEFNGQIYSINFNGYTYKNITLNGALSDKLFSGLLLSKDPNADFDFNGTVDFKGNVPKMDFITSINKLDLKELHFTNNADSGILSSQIMIDLNGSSIDDLSGIINFDNTIYKTKTRTFKLSTLTAKLEQNTEDKKIRMSSEYIDATVFGKFHAENIYPAFADMVSHYYPAFFKKQTRDKIYKDEFSFYVKVKNFKTINELFIPNLMISQKSTLEGNFDAANNKLNAQVKSSKLAYKSFSISDLVFILNENNENVLAELSGKGLHLSDSLNIENFNIVVNSMDQKSSYSIDWDNLRSPNSSKGDIKGRVYIDSTRVEIINEKLLVTLSDSIWSMPAPSTMIFDNKRGITVDRFTVTNKQQEIDLMGKISNVPSDSLVVHANNLILEQFNPLLSVFSLNLKGILNGNVSLTRSDKNFIFNGNMFINKLTINNSKVGELVIHTNYHDNDNFISLDGFTSLGIADESGETSKNISFNGIYDLNKKKESIAIDFSARPANLSLLNPFLAGILTINHGFVNGTGKVHGDPSNIMIEGKFKLFNSEIKVDYTNVTYNITGDLEILPDQIRFSDLLMREKGSKAAPQGTINGNLFHHNFSKMQLDYDISYRNMLVLNTTENDNPSFYGKIYATGNAGIYGFINNLYMTVEATTNKHSKFYLPLDGPTEIGESDFITFVKKDTTQLVKENTSTGFNFEMILHATPEAQAQIIIDKKTGDILNVQGRGDLKLNVNTLGTFEMFGDYIITHGDYIFTLENVINKKFEIKAGSSISWSGNPMNAEVDVLTNYRQRASVAPLLNDTNGLYKNTTPVDCQLGITGKLFSPNIKLGIEFPNLDVTAKSRIESVLSDEAELNRQVFSFLLFRTFVTPLIYNTNQGGVSAGGAAASTGSELLSNRVSSFLNSSFGNLTGMKDMQVGVNYRPANQNNPEAFDIALSKQFFDNKVSVDGNFGVTNKTQNSNGLIGDVVVDYKLSQDGRFRLKAFYRSNDNTQQATAGGPYTQGAGFFYRVEFETFKSMYRNFQSKVKSKEPKTTIDQQGAP
ncbi:MAG: translocation/assembly module TamB domain-containing protein [bacterium]|nr:translocation/assembly module TamB domain-containing protein [bacterium]